MGAPCDVALWQRHGGRRHRRERVCGFLTPFLLMRQILPWAELYSGSLVGRFVPWWNVSSDQLSRRDQVIPSEVSLHPKVSQGDPDRPNVAAARVVSGSAGSSRRGTVRSSSLVEPSIRRRSLELWGT